MKNSAPLILLSPCPASVTNAVIVTLAIGSIGFGDALTDDVIGPSVSNDVSDDSIRLFAITKLAWIRKKQKKIQAQERQSKREYVSGESHYFQGQRYILKVVYENKPPDVRILKNKIIELSVRPDSSIEKRRNVLYEWYRINIKEVVSNLLNKWTGIIGVTPNDWGIRLMRTKWGSCNIEKKKIWLNLELSKKSIRCIEYILVHELVHLLVRKHGKIFIAYMDKFLPQWKILQDELNSAPLAHEDWKV